MTNPLHARPARRVHLPRVTCPGCDTGGGVWLVEQAHGTARVCTLCGWVEVSEGKAEGLQEFKRRVQAAMRFTPRVLRRGCICHRS
jgi:hypothetical protein